MARTAKPAAGASAVKKPASTKPAARGAGKSAAPAPGRTEEFNAIIRKAKLRGRKGSEGYFDADGNAAGPWADMLAELDGWAKRNKVRLSTREVDSGGGALPGGATPRSHTVCPTTTSSTERIDFVGGGHITILHTCTLRRQRLISGKCVFSCVGEILEYE